METTFLRGPGRPAKGEWSQHALQARRLYDALMPEESAKLAEILSAEAVTNDERVRFFTQAVLSYEKSHGSVVPSKNLIPVGDFLRTPVGFREFVTSKEYLDKEEEMYPRVLDAGCELNDPDRAYCEAILTGGIGSGKTTLALYTVAYQVYLLSCLRNPHRLYGLDPSSEILFIFQSINKQLAKGLDYQRFRSMIDMSPYFKAHFPYKSDLESELQFPNRIKVVPVSGQDTAAIGQNVIGGLIDELNYMAVVEKSKASVDKGTFDQATQNYDSISRRRKSRFLKNGKLPGILCLVSSKKYPGQFTDVKMAEAKTDPTIYVYDRRVWDIKPETFADGEWFNVFAGDITRKPHILKPDEKVADVDRELVVAVPDAYRRDFERDIINALREVAGISTLARHPFFQENHKVARVFRPQMLSIFSQSPVDFRDTKLTLVKKAFYRPELPRFVHIDLAITGDSAGLAIGACVGFKNIMEWQPKPGNSAREHIKDIITEAAYMPVIRFDGTLEIKPPRGSEILFYKIRSVIFALRDMGLNIRWVTLDQFQSTDSQQILRQKGIITGQQSVDIVPTMHGSAKLSKPQPYDYFKNAVYEGRVLAPSHPHLQTEILCLEKDTKTCKVDHPPGGSKDCSDAMAAVVYGLTMRRETWAMYNIPISAIPSNVQEAKDNLTKTAEDEEPEYNRLDRVRTS